MLNQRLQQKLLQKLSPQQIQMIKLLEIPTMMLEQRIKKELEENPMLEEVNSNSEDTIEIEPMGEETPGSDPDEFTLEDYLSDEDIPNYRLSTNNYSADDKRDDIPFSGGSTFHESLKSQLGLQYLSEKQMQLADYLIGNIDDEGYLRRELDAIVDDVAFLQNIETTVAELEAILLIIQQFDPPGVGARDLRECLLLQLKTRDKSAPEIRNAIRILSDTFEEFTRKHYDKIQQKLNLKDIEIKEAMDEILHLNPKPGGSFNDPMSRIGEHVMPDFILDYKDDEFILSLNSRNVPELRLSNEYSETIESYSLNKSGSTREQKELVDFVKQKLDSARWFIDAIKQRQNTLMLTMQSILSFQKEYFIDGDETRMKPMILKDIADKTGLDISTISRVANSKYIQTHFGILPLKFFFSEGMQNENGEEVSTREIKKILQDCLLAEDKRKPITDDALADILKEKGYPIARRTVAKYREQLNIPVARLRREL
jgi:RNA polymerase sigma-54 factor